MPKKSDRELSSPVPIRFYEGDIEWLREHFPEIGYNRVVRELVAQLRRKIESKVDNKTKPTFSFEDPAGR